MEESVHTESKLKTVSDVSYWLNEKRFKDLISYELSQEKFSLKNKTKIKYLLQVSSNGIDSKYFKLRSFLANKQFKEADAETYQVMRKVAEKRPKQYLGKYEIRGDEYYLDQYDIEGFPCEDLKIIDDLWKKYSDEKFGFSVQKQIWLSCGGVPGEYDYYKYKEFTKKVRWFVDNKWVSYRNLNFTMGGVQGHLPHSLAIPGDYILMLDLGIGSAAIALFSRGDV